MKFFGFILLPLVIGGLLCYYHAAVISAFYELKRNYYFLWQNHYLNKILTMENNELINSIFVTEVAKNIVEGGVYFLKQSQDLCKTDHDFTSQDKALINLEKKYTEIQSYIPFFPEEQQKIIYGLLDTQDKITNVSRQESRTTFKIVSMFERVEELKQDRENLCKAIDTAYLENYGPSVFQNVGKGYDDLLKQLEEFRMNNEKFL